VARSFGHLSIAIAAVCGRSAAGIDRTDIPATVAGVSAPVVLKNGLLVAGIGVGTYGLYRIVLGALDRYTPDKRRQHDTRNIFRLGFGTAELAAALGVLIQQWVGLLFSLIGWLYIMLKQPYHVGDRVAIEEPKAMSLKCPFS
jgi:hypothetical protein